jgi:hypothetical protein
MTKHWRDTPEAADFIATGGSRETSPEIMQAIAFFSRNSAEAEALWNGEGFGTVCWPSDLYEHVTRNGLRNTEEFFWGASKNHWWPIDDPVPPGSPVAPAP